MKEVWRMWLLVRLFYKNRMVLASQACKQDAKTKFNERIKELTIEEFQKTKHIELLKEDEKSKILEEVYNRVKADMEKYTDLYTESAFYEYNHEAQVNRSDLTDLFLQEKGVEPSLFSQKNEADKERNRINRLEFNSILESCIDPKNNYIGKCDEKVCLTPEGKKFGGLDGLFKALIIELGVIPSVLVTAFVVGSPWIIRLSSHISPWW